MFSCFGGSRSQTLDDVGPNPPVEYDLATKPIANAHFIPLRLTMRERKIQRLMRGVMLASSYTNKVDRESIAATKRSGIIAKEVTSAMVGFVFGTSMDAGTRLLTEKDFTPYAAAIRSAVESCRRYKIMNPDLLRTDYVKFLYMLQDAASTTVQEALGFNVTSPIVTVGSYCEARGFADMLKDPRLGICITPVPKIADRNKLNKALRFKDLTVAALVKEYSKKASVPADDVEIAIRSLNDANNFANDNADSCVELLQLLRKYYSPEPPKSRDVDLSISDGVDGSRLTHEHSMQFMFVLQSLTLWKNISNDMFRLWMIAERDLLNPEQPYVFRNTGQGFQRVQPAPTLYEAVSEVLEATKAELGQWVGSERIHMGDDQVPNAFLFVDKYGQISRILVPLLRTINNIDEIAKDKNVAAYLQEVWGSAENAKIAILTDFFRRGFDGSGGDNMDDAGSCIDGRLTSAWNWCNNIRQKPFYPLFLMAGFTSFDGNLEL